MHKYSSKVLTKYNYCPYRLIIPRLTWIVNTCNKKFILNYKSISVSLIGAPITLSNSAALILYCSRVL